jgi:hypothetical protein
MNDLNTDGMFKKNPGGQSRRNRHADHPRVP